MINCVQAFNGFGFGDAGFQMSFGIGAFPFGLFASVFNVSDGRPAPRMYYVLYRYLYVSQLPNYLLCYFVAFQLTVLHCRAFPSY